MIKKRRDLNQIEVIDLGDSGNTISDRISIKTSTSSFDGATTEQFHVLPRYGMGCINSFVTSNMNISISNYNLHHDLVYDQSSKNDYLQIAFLLKGEKIIDVEDGNEILFENRESFMANIKEFNGRIRILGKSNFKEVKIKLPISFLIDHVFINSYELKKLTDTNLILPITDELYSILENLESKVVSGSINRIYIKAKVLELIAIQLENYKTKATNDLKMGNDKTLKKLYQIQLVIKSNLHKNFSLLELASEVGINSGTLNKEFIRIFGYSVKEFGTSEKMTQAKFMLDNSERMIYQIAEEVGYKNSTHFTAAFKRKFGITPKRYRNKN
ncbi:AraC-like DNA-binding protein [Saonia flava]|uniref:AraC-like DNA-binding protein n=1 Tax=Saonia flava TaxID=523696 RepID=A0A846R2Q5_9FLAO|nr:AraC family transcriptional regulator [Saonia flava]NJB72693.1 AraC-like DNA-binding protein [Saonia flava]